MSNALEKKTTAQISPKNSEPKSTVQSQDGSPAITAFTSFSGPIPPPNFLKEYELIVPGIAQRFLDEPHKEAEHRRALEKLMVYEQIKLNKNGQKMAFGLALLSICAAFSSIWLGYELAGASTFIVSICSLVGIFLYAKKNQN